MTDSTDAPKQGEDREPESSPPKSDPAALLNAEALILADRLGPLGKIDRGIYRIEVVIVVTAMVLMSVTVFADVLYQLMVAISQYLNSGDSRGFTLAGILLFFVGAMAFAAAGAGNGSRSRGARAGIAAGVVVAVAAFSYSLLHVESSTVYRALLILLGIPVLHIFWKRDEKARLAAAAIGGVIAFVLFGSLPTGYSWAQSYSLVMLLWVGFLGASMAARERRHLRVDLARKLLSPQKLPWFNVASYGAAAIFSGLVLYLGYLYMFGPDSTYIRPVWDPPGWLPQAMQLELKQGFPLPEDSSLFRRMAQVLFAPSEPGELPDWLKVMAIPVSLLLITLRFLGHAVVFARMGLAGESFNETTGAH